MSVIRDGLVGVAFQEIDDDFLADPRDVDDTPLLVRPGGSDADPARAVGVVLPLPVSVELDLHAAALVGEDLLAGRADDDGRPRPLDERLRSLPHRTEREVDQDAREGSVRFGWSGKMAGTEFSFDLPSTDDK
jgi:hypothetical protein